ncbi:hypothetical protein TNCV_2488161 [Trichonephila clavipes]|nr:hypothetical protein TNCV_2488161 [Trichonephila clavipes]
MPAVGMGFPHTPTEGKNKRPWSVLLTTAWDCLLIHRTTSCAFAGLGFRGDISLLVGASSVQVCSLLNTRHAPQSTNRS